MVSLKFDLPQLDYTTRFCPWQVKMRVILAQTSDLDDALNGFGKKLVVSWIEEEKQKDRKALSLIQLHLSNNILQEVLQEKSAVALWLKLELICMSKDLTSRLQVKMKLFQHKQQEGHSMMNHLLTRVNSTNVLDEGLRIEEVGRRMNSRVKSVKQGVYRK
jgi:hypothetical protein